MHATQPSTLTKTTPAPDYEAIKARQRATWATGDYGRIGVTLQIVGEELCESVRVTAADRVLDVAAGSGNASLAAARRFADVTSTDYVPELLEQGRRRAEVDGLSMLTQIADAEDLPFADASFDVVLSTFGAMFSPDHRRTAGQLLRVTKPGGRIGIANWTPDGFIGQLFRSHRDLFAAAGGARLSRGMGHGDPHRRAVRPLRPGHSRPDEAVRLQLPLRRALD